MEIGVVPDCCRCIRVGQGGTAQAKQGKTQKVPAGLDGGRHAAITPGMWRDAYECGVTLMNAWTISPGVRRGARRNGKDVALQQPGKQLSARNSFPGGVEGQSSPISTSRETNYGTNDSGGHTSASDRT